MARPRVVVVAKRSAYTKFVEEDQDPRARELLSRSDPSVRLWRGAHEAHVKTVDHVTRLLDKLGAHKLVLRGPRNVFDARDAELVVTVGGDGTLLSASHNVSKVPILGVNSAPNHSIGFFCAAQLSNLEDLLERALASKLKGAALARMEVTVDARTVSKRVLNEALFCHAIPAATSRYIVGHGRRREEQRSSGLWVSTAAGSTGAIRSAGGRILPLGSDRLQMVTREPYEGDGEPYAFKRLIVEGGKTLSVKSKMNDARLFLDGPFRQVKVKLGETIGFRTSDEPLTVLGLGLRRRPRR